MNTEEEIIPKNAPTMDFKFVPDFRAYCRGYTEIEVNIGFERISFELYELLQKLQSFPLPKDGRPIGLSGEEYESLDEKMVERKEVLEQFEDLLQVELSAYTKMKTEELIGLTKRGSDVLRPENRPLVRFGA